VDRGRVHIGALRRILIAKGICTAEEYDAAADFVRDQITP
jgi:hypothetical protein